MRHGPFRTASHPPTPPPAGLCTARHDEAGHSDGQRGKAGSDVSRGPFTAVDRRGTKCSARPLPHRHGQPRTATKRHEAHRCTPAPFAEHRQWPSIPPSCPHPRPSSDQGPGGRPRASAGAMGIRSLLILPLELLHLVLLLLQHQLEALQPLKQLTLRPTHRTCKAHRHAGGSPEGRVWPRHPAPAAPPLTRPSLAHQCTV